jgi:tetratricopeptide (TPR) repeat protein
VAVRPRDTTIRLHAAQAARRQNDYGAAQEHLRAYQQGNGTPEGSELEEKLWRLQEGDLRESELLLETCFEHPQSADTPLILEAFIKGSIRFHTLLSEKEVEVTLRRDSRIRQAADLWLQLRPSRADQAEGLYWRGWAQAQAGDDAPALTDLRAALELDPNHLEARWMFAQGLSESAPDLSVAHLEILRQRHPPSRRVWLALANARRNLGQLDEAGRLLDELLATYPDDVKVLLERGRVAIDAHQPSQAEYWLARAERLAPNEAEVQLAISRALRLAGQLEGAKRHEDRFEKLDAIRREKAENQAKQVKLFATK